MFILSAYDAYFLFMGVPVTPIIGFVALRTVGHPWPHIQRAGSIFILLILAALTLASSIWGLTYFGELALKGPLGMLLGIYVLGFVLARGIPARTLYDAFNIVIVLHLGFWAVQFIVFFTTGTVVDYLGAITGIPVRATYFGVTRFTGFFTEPAGFGFFLFMALGARLSYNRSRLKALDALILLAVVSTLSISAYFIAAAALILALVQMPRRQAVLVVGGLAVAVGAIVFAASRANPLLVDWLLVRATNPTADASGAVRTSAVATQILRQSYAVQALGIGVGNYGYSAGAVSGIQNLFEAFGLIGGSMFLGGVFTLFYTRGVTLSAGAVWALSLLSFSIWTITYWWLWTALLIVFSSAATLRASPRRSALPADHDVQSAVLAT